MAGQEFEPDFSPLTKVVLSGQETFSFSVLLRLKIIQQLKIILCWCSLVVSYHVQDSRRYLSSLTHGTIKEGK